MIRENILEEIRRLELKSGDIWELKKVMMFKNDSLNPIEKKELEEELVEMCEEGIFTKEGTGFYLIYRLTEFGENVVYSKQ